MSLPNGSIFAYAIVCMLFLQSLQRHSLFKYTNSLNNLDFLEVPVGFNIHFTYIFTAKNKIMCNIGLISTQSSNPRHL